MSTPDNLPPIQGYTFLQKLGEGTSGEVWKARREAREVAVKILKPGYETVVTEEFAILRQLDHPHILEEYEIGPIDVHTCTFPDDQASGQPAGRVCLVMELLKGRPMDKAEAALFSNAELEAMVRQLAEGLKYAHDKGIIHRDLKPANIFITPEKQVKILDFGVSAAISYDPHARLVAGSYSYMAPAQLLGKANWQNDIWSFGATLYQFLTGRHPYLSASLGELSEKLLLLEVDFPHHLQPRLSPKLSYVIMKCLRRNVRERYANFQEVLDDLDRDLVAETAAAYGVIEPARLVGLLLRRQRATAIAPLIAYPLGAFAAFFLLIFSIAYGMQIGDFALWPVLLVLFFFLLAGALSRIIPAARRKIVTREDLIQTAALLPADAYRRLVDGLQRKGWQSWDREFREFLVFQAGKADDQARAMTLAGELLNQDANNVTALMYLVRRHYYSGELTDAGEYCRRLLDLNPDDAVALFYDQILNRVRSAEATGVDQLAATVARDAPAPAAPQQLSTLEKRIFESESVTLDVKLSGKNGQPFFEEQEEILREEGNETEYVRQKQLVRRPVVKPVRLVLYSTYLENLTDAGSDTLPGTIPYHDLLGFAAQGELIYLKNAGWRSLAFATPGEFQEWGQWLANQCPDLSERLLVCSITERDRQPLWQEHTLIEERRRPTTGTGQEPAYLTTTTCRRTQRPGAQPALILWSHEGLELYADLEGKPLPRFVPFSQLRYLDQGRLIDWGGHGWLTLSFPEASGQEKWRILLEDRAAKPEGSVFFGKVLRQNLSPFFRENRLEVTRQWQALASESPTLRRDTDTQTERERIDRAALFLLGEHSLEIVAGPLRGASVYPDVQLAVHGRALRLGDHGWFDLQFDDDATLGNWRNALLDKPIDRLGWRDEQFDRFFERTRSERARRGLDLLLNELPDNRELPVDRDAWPDESLLQKFGPQLLLRLPALLAALPRYFLFVFPAKTERLPRRLAFFLFPEAAHRNLMRQLYKNSLLPEPPSISPLPGVIRAHPLELDMNTGKMTYRGKQIIPFSEVCRIAVTDREVKIHDSSGQWAAFPFRSTDYAAYLPVFCRLWADRIESR